MRRCIKGIASIKGIAFWCCMTNALDAFDVPTVQYYIASPISIGAIPMSVRNRKVHTFFFFLFFFFLSVFFVGSQHNYGPLSPGTSIMLWYYNISTCMQDQNCSLHLACLSNDAEAVRKIVCNIPQERLCPAMKQQNKVSTSPDTRVMSH